GNSFILLSYSVWASRRFSLNTRFSIATATSDPTIRPRTHPTPPIRAPPSASRPIPTRQNTIANAPYILSPNPPSPGWARVGSLGFGGAASRRASSDDSFAVSSVVLDEWATPEIVPLP